jgi:hypothetical protein
VQRFAVPDVVKQYMSTPTSEIIFEFFDPTDALCILATMSPLAADTNNLQLFARDSYWYEDFCDGERMHRVENALPYGSAALSSIIFFDGIHRDVKGFYM